MVSETDTDRLKCNADRFAAWTSESNVGRNRMYVSLPSIFKSGESNRLANACTDLLLRQIQLLPPLADIITKPIVLHSSFTSNNQYYNYYSAAYVIMQALLSLTCRLMKLFIPPDDMVNRLLL